MKTDCNLELQLVTPSVLRRNDYVKGEYHSMCETPNEKQLTIFYNGQIATCDATQLQAQAIIWLASRETEDKSDRNLPMLSSPAGYNNYPTNNGLSMKRSLQRFLQKRKLRTQETFPYHITNTNSNR